MPGRRLMAHIPIKPSGRTSHTRGRLSRRTRLRWDFARWLSSILRAEGEDIETTERDGAVLVIQTGWRVARELTLADPVAAFDAWNELWLGAAAAHDRFLAVQTVRTFDDGRWSITWRIAPR